jgi:serine/threonine protein kinase
VDGITGRDQKGVADDDSEFHKEVEIWSRLYHPHVLQFFGACHVGQKFIVSEFAKHGQLDHYLRCLEKQPAKREREVWRMLYEAALGLQYLHSRGVVHCDLKCNNILIGRDGKAKVSDYGLSRVRQQQLEGVFDKSSQQGSDVYELTGVGAPRWKAPEVLNGAEPTVQSDIYSFGMCVVEAVSGEYPWGLRHDELVSEHVRRGGALFSKPCGFSEAQWALVVGACRFEPADRLVLAEIVAQLEAFAKNDPELETGTGDNASSKLEELSEPDSFDSRSSGLSNDGACSRNSSYSESW